MSERGVEVDHVTVYRWVQRFTSLLTDEARFARHSPSDSWFVDETYAKVAGVWRYVYRAVDQHRQIIDVHTHRGGHRRRTGLPTGPRRSDPATWHHVEQCENNRIEAHPSRLKHRLRPMRCLRTGRLIVSGQAFIQNLRRGHYELAVETPRPLQVAAAFTELVHPI